MGRYDQGSQHGRLFFGSRCVGRFPPSRLVVGGVVGPFLVGERRIGTGFAGVGAFLGTIPEIVAPKRLVINVHRTQRAIFGGCRGQRNDLLAKPPSVERISRRHRRWRAPPPGCWRLCREVLESPLWVGPAAPNRPIAYLSIRVLHNLIDVGAPRNHAVRRLVDRRNDVHWHLPTRQCLGAAYNVSRRCS